MQRRVQVKRHQALEEARRLEKLNKMKVRLSGSLSLSLTHAQFICVCLYLISSYFFNTIKITIVTGGQAYSVRNFTSREGK